MGVGTAAAAIAAAWGGLNPFLVRVGVGTITRASRKSDGGLNPFLVRVGVGTCRGSKACARRAVLIPSWLGWVLEPESFDCQHFPRVLIPSWLGWVLERGTRRVCARDQAS